MSILMDGNNDEGVMNDINMTPLIDVMLVLLIIFIVTLPVINKAVKVDLPKAAAQPAESKTQDIDLSITADKTVLWNKDVVDDAALKLRVAAAAKQGDPPAVNINADQHVEYGKVAAILAALQGGGAEQDQFRHAAGQGTAMIRNRAFPTDRAEDRDARRHFPTVWKLIKPYWSTREGMLSALMLACVLGVGWSHTYIAVWLNRWTGTFYDAVGSGRFQALPNLLLQFLLVSMAAAALTMSTVVLQSIVEIRWRRWLTTWLADQWLARHTYYRIERDRALENIDQRIAEDAKQFVKDTLLLSMGVLQVPVSIVSFSVILWSIGHSLDLDIGGHTYQIHGYLVYAVFLYQGLFFWATHLLGRRLITLNAKQNRVEGDFRVLMVRVREFAEQIAFFDGSGAEGTRLNGAFRQVVSNLYALLWVNTRVALFTNIVGQVSSVVPTLLVLPQLMTGGG